MLNEKAEKEMLRCCPDCGIIPGLTSVGKEFSLSRLNNECECCRGAREIKVLGNPNKVAMEWGEYVNDKIQKRSGRLVYISASELFPHPDNPRKEIRDIEELTESVKVKGVMQNLTVVKGHHLSEEEIKKFDAEAETNPEIKKNLEKGWMPDRYTVIIGHRRLEAAKGAGLGVLPCRIADMDYKEQLTVMLMENVQRNDLTVYEQAKGFQLLLNLGDTIENIAEKSGFSKTTVRRRVKLAELDEGKLKAASERQISLMDLDKLNQVEDIETRNELLDSIGTANFNNAVMRAIGSQEREKNTAKWRKVMIEAGLAEIPYSECYNGTYTMCERSFLEFSELDNIENFEKSEDEKYFAINYNTVYFRKDYSKEIAKVNAAEERCQPDRWTY